VPANVAASHCARCGWCAVPQTAVCAGCGGEPTAVDLPGEGVLYAFTRVHVGTGPRRLPYVVGYVDHPVGVRIFAQIIEPPDGELHTGMAMRLTAPLSPGDLLAAPWAPVGPATSTRRAGRP
jgi:uncharacterized OB-fold protein